MTKQDMLELLKGEKYCVISTINSFGRPESAFVGFSVNDKLEILIGTSVKSRKYKNITFNPRVSIVFIFDGKKTVQYEGIAREITDDKEYKERTQKHFQKNPEAMKYEKDPMQTYLIVDPKWVRFSVAGPKVVGEVRFNA